MRLFSFSTADVFLARTHTYLDQDAARHGLILGIALALQRGAEQDRCRPYLAAVVDDGEPMLVALMTPPHNLLLTGPEEPIPSAIALVIEDLIAGAWAVPGILAPTPWADPFAEAWHERTEMVAQSGMNQRVYTLQGVQPVPTSPGCFRPAKITDVPVVAAWIKAFHDGIAQGRAGINADKIAHSRIEDGSLYLWEDGQPVSMAASTRPTGRTISIGLVYTPPLKRGQGYATCCVATLSQQLLDAGYETITLFADVANPTSNAIYRRIGFRPSSEWREYRFGSYPA